uniref:U1 small nuclear ribonucleoprotein 70 kDa n=1 Tax=Myxobolus squamalis TaxID=59785 RepID=A0A6B2G4J8_MYXSQ
MTQFLPPNLLSLFFPRDPLPFKIPPKKKKCPKSKQYSGVSAYLDHFEEPLDLPPVIYESRFERRERKLRERQENEVRILEEKKSKWDPKSDTTISTDPYKTLFIGRLSYETTESRLKREFEIYGPIKQIYVIKNKFTGVPRGYAFIEYEHTRDMHAGYKHMDGKKIDGRRVIVDAERGRAERHWLPRYLGGGLGAHRRMTRPKKTENQTARKMTSESFDNENSSERKYRDGMNQFRDQRDRRRDSENFRPRNESGYRDRRRSRSKQDGGRRNQEDDSKKTRKRQEICMKINS